MLMYMEWIESNSYTSIKLCPVPLKINERYDKYYHIVDNQLVRVMSNN